MCNGWTVDVKLSNDWTVNIQQSDGWTVYVQLSNGFKVYVQLETQIVILHKLCRKKTILIKHTFWKNTNCYKIQTVKKKKLCWNTNRDETQIVTRHKLWQHPKLWSKHKLWNCEKLEKWQNSNFQTSTFKISVTILTYFWQT